MPYERGNKDGKHYWLTPPAMMHGLQLEFHFDFDACPFPRPDNFDGLQVDWGESTWVNPPFESPTKWVHKAIAEYRKSKKKKTIVFAFPTDKWIHYLLREGAEFRSMGDVKWCAIEDGSPGKGIGRHTMLFILNKKSSRLRSRFFFCDNQLELPL